MSTSPVPSLPRPSTPPGIPPPDARRPPSKLSYGVVCSSNINRSMEAHVVLGNAGMLVLRAFLFICVVLLWLEEYRGVEVKED
jgi:hypothetical protein